MTNPPSLHRYLYAFQNPTIFVDPNGRIAFLKWIQEKLEGGGTENAAEAAELIQDELGGVAGAAAGGVLGVARAAADATAGLVGLLKASKRAPDVPRLQEVVQLFQTPDQVVYPAGDGTLRPSPCLPPGTDARPSRR